MEMLESSVATSQDFGSLYITYTVVSGAQLKTRAVEDNSCTEWV